MRANVGLMSMFGGGLALAACSPSMEDQSAKGDAAGATTTAPAAASTTPPPGDTTRSGGLRGQVSGLNASISDLSTRVTTMGTVIDLFADTLFEFDKAALTPAAETQLRKAATMIAGSHPGTIKIIGHTDSKGDDAYNQRLSQARAEAVAAWFRQQPGVRQRSFEVSAKGETAPIQPNARPDGTDNPSGRAKNRRVEIVLPNPA